LYLDGSSQTFQQHRSGIYRTGFGSLNPKLIEISIATAINSTNPPTPVAGTFGGHVIFEEYTDINNYQSDRQVIVMGIKYIDNAGNWVLCFEVPTFAQAAQWCTSKSWGSSVWVKFSMQLYWDNQNITVWYHNMTSTGDFDQNPIILFRGMPFYNPQASSIAKVETYIFGRNTKLFVDTINFCNDAGGAAYQPVTQDTAVQMSQSLMLQSISGKVDLSFSRQYSTTTFSQTSNFKLKGGDTTKIDLLDLAKTTDSFQQWKITIAQNPAPVFYVLKDIAYLFPNNTVNGVNQQDEMKNAIATYLVSFAETDIIYNTSPDADVSPGSKNPDS